MSDTTILLVEGARPGVHSLAPALRKGNLSVTVVQIRPVGAKKLPPPAGEAPSLRVVPTFNAAFNAVLACKPDLVVLDTLGMRSTAVGLCRRLRRALGETPIVHCRALSEKEDRSVGADVYLAHPFTPRKLLNRVRALLPADELHDEIVRAGSLTLYVSKRSVRVEGRAQQRLTPKLAALLEEFLRHPNEVLGRHELMRRVWKTDYFGDTRTLDVHIRWLRELIEENPAEPILLRTVRGVGYVLQLPEEK
jgi:two-component system, OmpR family, phosphate regulon response regulator PhoB